jgi:V/A-type H+-transporting ATPase subunit I
MLRPSPARWFSLLCGNAEVVAVLETLAQSRGVELVARGAAHWHAAAALRELLDDYAALRHRFAPNCPQPQEAAAPRGVVPLALAQQALAAVHDWERVAGSLVEEQVRLEHAAGHEALQLDWLQTLAASQLDPTLAPLSGPGAATRLFLLPHGVAIEPLAGTLLQRLAGARRDFLVAVGPSALLDEFAARVDQARGRPFTPLAREGNGDPVARQAERLRIANDAVALLRQEIERVSAARQLAHHLATLEWLAWTWEQGRGQAGSQEFAWITGWIERSTARELDARLAAAGVAALVAFPPPPAGSAAPVVLDNPRWVAPFEQLTRLFGLPGPDEADPSPLLVFGVPLLFGYMFGDLGQGLVIAALGFALRDRFPIAALAIPCGFSAALFGLLFGSVFGLEGVVPALWLHPIDAPLAVLLPPLLAGVVLLLTGSGLGALAAHWHGRLGAWWRDQGGLLLGYLTVLGLLLPPLAWLPGLGLAFWFGQHLAAAWRERRLLAFGGLLFEWLEQSVRLLVNTLSFARVGAFALAHAGLSLATVQLAEALPWTPAQVAVLVLGNLVVLGLEGLIVSIQTTRLMLFEFFLRFLQGQGRALRPLAAPRFSQRRVS